MRSFRSRYAGLAAIAAVLAAAACRAPADAADVADALPADAADAADVPPYAATFRVVDVPPDTPAPVQLAVQACAGLFNRALGGSVYTRMDANDARWLDELALAPAESVGTDAFLASCLARFPACVRYDYAAQRRLLPNVLTVGAVLGAVPVDVGMTVPCGTVAFDATVEFREAATPALATQVVAGRYLDATAGLAMLNPGYDLQAKDLANPAITRDMPAHLVDFVFSERLFVVFLVNGCIGGSPENAVLSDLVARSPWPRPIGVYGYNNSWLTGGYQYEAQTLCLDSRGLGGAIATEAWNLSFFSSRGPPIVAADALDRNPPEEVAYDPATTYVAFVIGDGDNVQFVLSTRNVWLGQRLAACQQAGGPCAPLTWSLSPHLARLAPDVLRWYYRTTRKTGKDFFILPPSGHLYAYPSSLSEADQDRFVAATEADARILGTAGTVHWDWFTTWSDAETRFLPKYARKDGAIRGVFPVNVPYMFGMFTWWEPDRFFEVLVGPDGGETALFRPREWRGVDGSGTGDTAPFFVTPQQMADELAGYPPGTVTWVYMTSDGGLSLENSFQALVPLLPARVRLVSADAAARLAIEAFHAAGPAEVRSRGTRSRGGE